MPPASPHRLDAARFVVMGEGLAAGMADFSLSATVQAASFPAQMARQMGVAFRQPLFQPPGLGSPPGFPALPMVVPALLQTTVFTQLPEEPFSNLSVPGFTLSDALGLRPTQPMIRRNHAKQTLANLILEPLAIVHGKQGPLPTQLECALKQEPTFTIIELGYYEALDAAIQANPGLLCSAETLASGYERIVTSLRQAGSDVLLLTVPDPIDTACFSALPTAAAILKVHPALLEELYKLPADSRISVNGLIEIGFQLLSGRTGALPADAVYAAGPLAEISSRIARWNETLLALGRQHGVMVYNLHALFRQVASQGVGAASRIFAGSFLGGFYSLNGCYLGATGHAIIANELLCLINRQYGTAIPLIDIGTVAAADPAAAHHPADGEAWGTEARLAMLRAKAASQDSDKPTRLGARTGHAKWGVPNLVPAALPQPLQIPPGGQQILALNPDASYVGDAFLMLNCPPGTDSQWASCGAQLFGGLAMTDSHLKGYIQISFTPPVDGITQFTVSIGNGLAGDDTPLAAPQFYRFPLLNTRVLPVSNPLVQGSLNLATHEVSDLQFDVFIVNSGLMALASVNPGFPRQAVSFPGQYGSAWAQFEQRDDGNLDFTLHGSTFLPLGDGFAAPLRLPLPFAGPSLQYATIPCRGTALHPHLHLSTKPSDPPPHPDEVPNIPPNTVREYVLFTHNSAFGDTFTLNSPGLGGPATGRSQILGRVQIQFGPRTGNSVPFAISPMNPGGILADFPASPITQVFPGKLSPGPQGFNEFLRFPLRTYPLDDVTFLTDPFDLTVGAVDIRSGRVLGGLLSRGFISQDLFFALLRVEPRTPRQSFFFRGPALFQRETGNQTVFRFAGTVMVPYPEGFLFPEPDLATGIVIGPSSRLDPFFWVHAIHDEAPHHSGKRGSASNVIASTGDRFSYSYDIPPEGRDANASFHYENHTQGGAFRMHSLAWVAFANSGSSPQTGQGDFDTVTFTGFGIWTKDNVSVLRQAAVQISTSPVTPYIAIQIDTGTVSNVNTKPPEIQSAQP